MTNFSIPLYVWTGFAAFAMAGVAAFFSISGLASLYSAAAIPVIIMGTCIEISKIASTVWLHHFWKKANIAMTVFLSFMVIASMAITSGGVYGYLTSSYASQEAPNQQKQLTIDRLDQQIKTEQDKVSRYESRISSLDNIVSTSLTQGTRGGQSADRINRRQTVEREQLQSEIDSSHLRIDQLTEQRIAASQEQVASEAKLGAVKYLAALFDADPSKAVMYFTLIMVLLLDPFAIILVIATQYAYSMRSNNNKIDPELKNDSDGSGGDDDSSPKTTLPTPIQNSDEQDQPQNEWIEEPTQNSEPTKKQLVIPSNKNEENDININSVIDDYNPISDSINLSKTQTFVNPSPDVKTAVVDDPTEISVFDDRTDDPPPEVLELELSVKNEDEAITQAINALSSTLPPEKMDEVSKRWLE